MSTQRSTHLFWRTLLAACASVFALLFALQLNTASIYAAPVAPNCDELAANVSALFTDAHCQGSKETLGSEGFITLVGANVEPRTASSLKLAPGTSARLYSGTGKSGSFVCFNETKRDFAVENFLRNGGTVDNRVGSLIFFADDKCGWPDLPELYNATGTISNTRVFSVSWQEVWAGTYWAELEGPNGFKLASGPKIENQWLLGPLAAGVYNWKVQGEVLGFKSEWTSFKTFTVTAPIVEPDPDPEPVDPKNCDEWPAELSALFTDAHCQGSKETLGSEGFITLVGANVEPRTASSLKLAPGTSARLYSGTGKSGSFVCFNETKRDFAVENFMRNGGGVDDATGSLEFFNDDKCGWPLIPQLYNPFEPKVGQRVNLKWDEVYAGSYRVEVYGPTGQLIAASGAYTTTEWLVGPLAEGVHTWKVQGEVFNIFSEWTQTMTFTVAANSNPDPDPDPDPEDDCGDLDGPYVMIFPLKDCKGNPLTIRAPGTYSLVNTGFEDSVGAMYVPSGSVRVFENADQTGLTSLFTVPMWDLQNDAYWNSVTSVGATLSSLTWYSSPDGTISLFLPLINR